MPSVPELLTTRAGADPERAAVECAGLPPLTFLDWELRANAVANRLVARGIRPGDRVALLFSARDWTGFAVAYVGVQRAGGVAVPLAEGSAADTVAHALAHSGAATVLYGEAERAPEPRGLCLSEVDGRDASGPGHTLRPGDLAQILYTSGTTGRAKAVGATHANLTYGCAPMNRRRRLAHSERFLHAFPIGTNAAQTMLMAAIDARPAALTLPRFTPERFARLAAERRVGTVFLVPAMAIELLAAGVHERHDLSCVRLLGSTAAPLPPNVAARLAQAFPAASIANYYTSTEAAPAQTTMLYDPGRPASLGRPASPGDLRIDGATGPGQTGEIWLRCPTLPRVYLDDAADTQAGGETAPGFRDGWIRMGDLGYLDEDGYLYLVDRESDLIKIGAHRVSTLRVEAALHDHPDVTHAAAFGVPHPVLGTAVAAAVVSSQPLSAPELRAFLEPRLARHELPARVLMLDSLPRNPAGKVLKSELRRRAQRENT